MKRLMNYFLLVLTLGSCAQSGIDAPFNSVSDAGAPARSSGGGHALPAIPTGVDHGSTTTSAPVQAAAQCGNGIREGNELCDGSDCPTECASAACLQFGLLGSAETCDARCIAIPIGGCASGDGCCPNGCNQQTDADCSPLCGDGVVSSNETCEPGSVLSPCPSVMDCDDHDPCTQDWLTGSSQQCSARCSHIAITQIVAGDRCCPSGANVSTDSDCSPSCGDGVVSVGEQCDPGLPGSCATASVCDRLTVGCSRGVLVGADCESRCELEAILTIQHGDQCCPTGADVSVDSDCDPRCGDGVVSPGEECDPSVPRDEYGRCPMSDDDCTLPAGDGCQHGVLIGDPTQCTARCTLGPREVGLFDACCPDGASSHDDPDCGSVCGNGLLEKGETCDDGPGSPLPCPKIDDCNSLDQRAGCSGHRLVGSGNLCNAQCELHEIVNAIPEDSCCPTSQASSNDCIDVARMYGPCTWISAYPPSYVERTGNVDPKASQPYGCDGRYSVCSAEWCDPVCDPGNTTDAEGRPGRCVKAFPNSFEVFCNTDVDCPADRECGTTINSTVKTCLRGLRRS